MAVYEKLKIRRTIFYAFLLMISFILFYTIYVSSWFSKKYPLPERTKLSVTDGFYHGNLDRIEDLSLFSLDNNDIRIFDYGGKIGKQYNIVTISEFVLALVPFVSDEKVREIFFKNLNFIIDYGQVTKHGNLVFPYYFDFPVHNEKSPWFSAMAQGEAASALLWGYRLTNELRYYIAAKKAILAMVEPNNEYKFIKNLKKGVWLKEYPEYQYHVLDGSLAALSGVYDLFRSLKETDGDKEKILSLLEGAFIGLKRNHSCFACRYGGHYFSDDLTMSTQGYYSVNLALLDYLSSFDNSLLQIKKLYSLEGKTLLDKMKIYFIYKYNKLVAMPLGLIRPCVN